MPTIANALYDEYDSPRMGEIRKSSARNPLLVKPILGAVKRITEVIPDEDYIYGMCNEYGEGVREVMIHQNYVGDPDAKKGPDFKAMNKLAPGRHVVRASGQRQFRDANYRRLRISRRLGGDDYLPSKEDPDFVYGRPMPPAEDLFAVMQNAYGNDWIKMQTSHHHQIEVPIETSKFIVPRSNKSSQLLANSVYHKWHKDPPKERFIISRFKNVPKRIDNVNPTPLKRD